METTTEIEAGLTGVIERPATAEDVLLGLAEYPGAILVLDAETGALIG